MRKLASILTIAALLCGAAYAGGVDAYVIPLSSPVYEAMDALYAINGMASPSTSRPWTVAEARHILSRVDAEGMDSGESNFYRSVEELLAREEPTWMLDEDSFGLSTTVSLNPEYYWHDNSSFDNDVDWVWDYEHRKPFLNLELEMSVFSWFYTTANAQYTKGRWDGRNDGIWYYDPNTDYPYGIGAGIGPEDDTLHIPAGSISWADEHNTNFPILPETFEFDWPKRAFIAFAGPHWSLTFGRDRMNWGNARIGNLLIDDGLEYHDALRLKLYTQNVFEYEVMFSFFDDDWSGAFHESDSFKMLMAHRIAFRPADWISFTLSENIMYRSSVLEGQSLNPAFIFHNLNNRDMFNALAWGELSIAPFKGLEIYAQFAIDQGKLPQESASERDAWAVLGSLDYTHLIGKGVLEAGFEAAYTTPLIYRRDKVDFIVPHRTATQLAGGDVLKLFYVGFPYGGDTIAMQLDLSYKQPGVWGISSAFRAVVHGSMDMMQSHNREDDNDGYPNKEGSTPTGPDISCTLIGSLAGDYHFPSIAHILDISFFSNISIIDRFMLTGTSDANEPEGMDIQLAIGMSIAVL